MKQMSRDPQSRAKALRAERRADEKSGLGVITIKPLSSAATGSSSGVSGAGFKKGGFRNAFGRQDDDDDDDDDDEKRDEHQPVVGGDAPERGRGGLDGKGNGGGGGGGGGGEEVRRDGLKVEGEVKVEIESESEEDEGAYDPRRPSGCGDGCTWRGGL